MDKEVQEFNKRIMGLKNTLRPDIKDLKIAVDYIYSDPKSSLTKTRVFLEGILIELYKRKIGTPPSKLMLGPMLQDSALKPFIAERIRVRMNSIREMGNLGPHTGEADSTDAIRVMRDLLDVIEWYNKEFPLPVSEEIKPPTFGEIIDQQIELMKGYPISYLRNTSTSDLEQMIAQDLNIYANPESSREVAFRFSFPQFLDWLRNQVE